MNTPYSMPTPYSETFQHINRSETCRVVKSLWYEGTHYSVRAVCQDEIPSDSILSTPWYYLLEDFVEKSVPAVILGNLHCQAVG